MILPLFKKELKTNGRFLLAISAVLIFYLVVIVYMFDPELAKLLDGFTQTMPNLMKAFGMSDPGTTLTSFLVSYFYGFFILVFPLIYIIAMNNRLLLKYIDDGSMAYLLATPHSRRRLLLTQFIYMVGSLVVMVVVIAGVGLLMCQSMFPGQLDTTLFVHVHLAVFAIQFLVSGLCFCLGVFINDARKAMTYCIGIPAFFYVIHMVSNLGGVMEWLKYFTIYSLYQPSAILSLDSFGLWSIIISLVIGVACYGLSIWRFDRRDLNV